MESQRGLGLSREGLAIEGPLHVEGIGSDECADKLEIGASEDVGVTRDIAGHRCPGQSEVAIIAGSHGEESDRILW